MEYSLAVDQTGAVWEWGHFPQGYFQNLVANVFDGALNGRRRHGHAEAVGYLDSYRNSADWRTAST